MRSMSRDESDSTFGRFDVRDLVELITAAAAHCIHTSSIDPRARDFFAIHGVTNVRLSRRKDVRVHRCGCVLDSLSLGRSVGRSFDSICFSDASRSESPGQDQELLRTFLRVYQLKRPALRQRSSCRRRNQSVTYPLHKPAIDCFIARADGLETITSLGHPQRDD